MFRPSRSLARGAKDKQARRLTDAERPVECLIYIVGECASGSALGKRERERKRRIERLAFFYFPVQTN